MRRAAALLLPSLLSCLGCGEPEAAATRCGNLALERPLLVLEGDERSASALGRLGSDGCFEEVADVALGVDASMANAGGRPFVCNRTSGDCFAIHRDRLALDGTFPTYESAGDRSVNPHDVAVDDAGKLWIARYDRASLAVLTPQGAFDGEVDLSAFAGADGVPEMEALVAFDGKLFVALERLDELRQPTEPGLIALVDAKTRDVVGSIALLGDNPFGPMTPVLSDASRSTVSLTTPGRFDDATCAGCGVELIDLASRTTRQVLREADVGGSISRAILVSATEGYAIAAGPEEGINPTWVLRFDPSTGATTSILADTRARGEDERGYYHWGLAINGPYVLVGDRTPGKARIRAFLRDTGEEVGAVPVSLYPPVDLLVL